MIERRERAQELSRAQLSYLELDDEFEELELHSTNLIDRKGRLRWVRTGGDPFMNIGFVLGEIDRIEKIAAKKRLRPVGKQ